MNIHNEVAPYYHNIMASDENSKAPKGAQVRLQTFLNWNIDFGYEEVDGLVSLMWCKLCRKHIQKIAREDKIRGKALSDLQRIAAGTNFTSKHTATRHINGSKTSILNIGLSFYLQCYVNILNFSTLCNTSAFIS